MILKRNLLHKILEDKPAAYYSSAFKEQGDLRNIQGSNTKENSLNPLHYLSEAPQNEGELNPFNSC